MRAVAKANLFSLVTQLIAANLSVMVKPAIRERSTIAHRHGAIRGLGGQRACKANARNLGDPS
ncbi:hypothetical protein Lepil_3448 [Leptonema illini DSM 21528]|uniref:Uncharacterized protein n=1 Tax=Leptonema illini DSM 21528 TaxID=929563 RepID=H2CIT9_9LEPT|nr:hypothetical protein Lepil_0536 [Leptonema illini DSM 21528]EHQ06610.1 hypothetical protein Lepil_1927 [Leptonema illini DSM 21528]EHQ08106.1 hypothetical protein Lepil_3448 [Leptonema illini DSM 21528]